MGLAVDYSAARPDPQLLKARGISGVLRYISHSKWKNITAAELSRLQAAGLHVTLNWETTADRPMSGAAGGVADGRDANAMANALGYPHDSVIYYSLDTDDRGQRGWEGKVEAYLRAAAAQGRPAGIYGSVRVVDEMHRRGACNYFWQAQAWSGKAISPHAHLYQRVHATVPVPGTDENEILRDPYGQWGQSRSGPPQPAPNPPAQEQDMYVLKVREGDILSYRSLSAVEMHVISQDQYVLLAFAGVPQMGGGHEYNVMQALSMGLAFGVTFVPADAPAEASKAEAT